MSPVRPRVLSARQRRRLLALALAAAAAFFCLAVLAELGVAIDTEWRVQRAAQTARVDGLEAPMRVIS
jgi:hypothetical protein